MKTRTTSQNNSIHKWFEMVEVVAAQEGVTFDQVVMEKMELPLTKELMKALWRAVQYKMYGTTSTTEMTTAQVDKIYDVLNKHLGQVAQIHIPFPDINSKTLLEDN